jgi:glycosyltransferase involved in cell wall biosynthesis
MVGVLETEGHRPDLLHAHVFSTGFLAVLCGRRRRLPVVISEHYTDVVEGRLTRWERVIARYAYRHADVVCPVSALLEHSISKLEPRARTQIVPNVVDVDTFARPRIGHTRTDNGGVRIVAVAGLARYKGLGHLIDAFELLLQEQPDASLDIVGEGPDREALEARSIGLPVRFLGQRSREEVADLMARSDVLAVSSLVETFGIAAVEALAAGMRVVATDGCGSADVVAQHGGLVVPVGDSVAMKDALSTLLGRGRRDARHTAEVLRATYGPDAVAAAWDELYRSVA